MEPARKMLGSRPSRSSGAGGLRTRTMDCCPCAETIEQPHLEESLPSHSPGRSSGQVSSSHIEGILGSPIKLPGREHGEFVLLVAVSVERKAPFLFITKEP